MEIRHLQSFIALAEEGQFTAAARKLNIVQSGLSVTIKEMEQELGVQLVNRTTRNLSLTRWRTISRVCSIKSRHTERSASVGVPDGI
jgi:hypothetical protein